MKIKLLILTALFPIICFSQNRFVSNSGNDSNTGLDISHPWQTMVKVRSAHQTGAQIHAGDTVFFKRGDTFTPQNSFNGCQIWGSPTGNAVSGTSGNPIVWDAYGSGDAPNFLFTLSGGVDTTSRRCLSFEGVQYYVIRNLSCIDTRRMPVNHVLGAYCAGFVQFGERGSGQETRHCKVENCTTYGTGLSFIIVGDYDSIVNCTGTEFGNVDAVGGDSYGANFATISGNHHYIVGNYIADCWAYSDAFSPYFNGGAIEAFNTVDSCFIGYNTVTACSGLVEFGATAGASTCKQDTFAYNKILNVGDISYINVSGIFAIQPTSICFFNNVVVENDSSLFSGPNGNRLMQNFPTYPGGYAAVFRGFYNNGSPSSSVIYNLSNNLIRNYNHFTIILTPSKTTHTFNGYNLTGGSTIGTSLSTGEGNVTDMWADTTSGLVQNWNFRLKTAINGATISPFTHDFYNVFISGITMQGIAQFGKPANSFITPGYIITNGAAHKVDRIKTN